MVGSFPMLTEKLKVDEVLTTLSARDSEELSVFRMLFYCAHFLHRRNQGDMGLDQGKKVINEFVSFDLPTEAPLEAIADPFAFIREIPAQSMRYFHGLVEALDIYKSIHGKPAPQAIEPTDAAVKELKQIRDLCIHDGLHSIY